MTRDELIEEAAHVLHERFARDYHDREPARIQAQALADAGLLREESWGALMALLDKHWPEDIFPTPAERPEWSRRDPGPTIVGLIRWVDQLRGSDV